MSNKIKKELVPALRFPEFENKGEWEPKMLGDKDVSDFVKKRLPLSELSIETYVSTENILADFGGIAKASKLPPSGSFTAYKSGDILIANIRPYLKKVWIANRNGGASNDVVVVRPKNGNAFLSCILRNEAFINYVMQGAKGVKMPRGDIALMKEYPIAVPDSEEQQKITECLSSLEELITACTQKHQVLQSYKKSLMQNLFPSEGKTVPVLRFPEFKTAGHWNEINLTDIAKTSIGLVTTMTKFYAKKGVPLIRNSDIKQNGVRKEKLIYLQESFANTYPSKKLKKNDIVTVHTGDIGVSALIDGDLEGCLGFATLNTRIFKNNVLPEFICYFFNSQRYLKFALSMATGDGRNNFNLSDFDRSVVPMPKDAEQRKIVELISSIDELITTQAQKIEELKAHKKGLMQQLFPAMDEVTL